MHPFLASFNADNILQTLVAQSVRPASMESHVSSDACKNLLMRGMQNTLTCEILLLNYCHRPLTFLRSYNRLTSPMK